MKPRAVDAALFADRERGRHDGAAGMRLRRRVRVVGLVRMREHAVGERRLNGPADDRSMPATAAIRSPPYVART